MQQSDHTDAGSPPSWGCCPARPQRLPAPCTPIVSLPQLARAGGCWCWQGIFQLHSHIPQIVHADLKTPNLVCDAHWRVKVTDFNLSRVVGDQTYSASLVANNPRWQAPEVIRTHSFSVYSDVFSFGVVGAFAPNVSCSYCHFRRCCLQNGVLGFALRLLKQ